jgi:hypothetical protein
MSIQRISNSSPVYSVSVNAGWLDMKYPGGPEIFFDRIPTVDEFIDAMLESREAYNAGVRKLAMEGGGSRTEKTARIASRDLPGKDRHTETCMAIIRKVGIPDLSHRSSSVSCHASDEFPRPSSLGKPGKVGSKQWRRERCPTVRVERRYVKSLSRRKP